MLLYKSFCRSPKTFYGVTFNYGDSKAVSGYINDRRFVCLDSHYMEPKEHLEAKVSTAVVKEVSKTTSKSAAPEDSKSKKVELKKSEKQLESKKAEVKKEEKPAAKKSEEKKAETKDKVEKAKTTEKKPEVKKEEKKS